MSAADDIDRIVEIERLAALDPIVYEVARAEAAKRLGMRAHVLDRVVAKKRRELGLETDEDDDGQGRAVKIVDVLPWHEPVDGDQIAETVAAAVKTYAVLPDTAPDAIALWVLHTWLVNGFSISPRLAVTSPTKGCGKTTVLRFLTKVVRRPKRAGSISPSALFRVVEKFQPCVLLDETEKYIEHGSDLHALLNEGHAKGGTVLRVLGEKLELREFAIFGAVAFARNGKLPDDLEQRSIVIEMQRRRADEPLAELRDDRCESLQRIARMCARWADDNANALADCDDPDMGLLINRDADNWRPLYIIASTIGADWPGRIRDAAAMLAPRESESVGPMLLADIKAVFDDKGLDRLASVEICAALTVREDRPWAEWKASKGASPKPLTPNQLARLLKPFGIAPTGTIRVEDRTFKGYYAHQFGPAWDRYRAERPEGVNEPSHRHNATAAGTSATFSTVTTESDVTVEKCEKPLGPNDCDGVTVQKGGNGHAGASEEPGLSWRAIDRLAREIEEWAYARRDTAVGPDELEAEIRRRLTEAGIFQTAIEIETERVMQCLFETREAQRHQPATGGAS
jgi:putative DNA primase/helicase